MSYKILLRRDQLIRVKEKLQLMTRCEKKIYLENLNLTIFEKEKSLDEGDFKKFINSFVP